MNIMRFIKEKGLSATEPNRPHDVAKSIPRLSEKERLILGILSDGREHFGLEMVKESGGHLKRGTVYVTLGRMEEKDYISSRREDLPPEDRRIPKRLYHSSRRGQRILAAWEAASIQLNEVSI